MGNEFMKGLRIADTQELCFEAWKRSDMACSVLPFGQFADSKKSGFQASKRSYMSIAVFEGVRSADIHGFFSQAAKRSDIDCFEQQVCLFADCQKWNFRSRNFQILVVPSCKRVDLLMFKNSGFRVLNVKYVQCSPAMRLIC